MDTFQIGECAVTVGPSWVVTRWPDGAELHAHADDSGVQSHIAQALGYGDDVARMNREHDTLHSLVAEARGWASSKTLRGVADGEHAPKEVAEDEERIVMLVQRLLNVGLGAVLADKRL